jgi:dipeptidyl-peptidase-4
MTRAETAGIVAPDGSRPARCWLRRRARALRRAQAPPPLNAELERIFAREEYTPETFTQPAWIEGGVRYAAVEPSTSAPGAKDAKDIVEYDTATGTRTVLVAATSLKPAGAAAPLAIDGYAWSADRTKLLLYTNSKKVWRQNTRGDYWVLDRASGTLRQLGAGAAPATLMFAKFSPDGRRVGYVRDRDLYVEDVASGAVTRLTKAENEQIINGTSDWVYEEELDPARRLPLEPRRPPDRLLAVRHRPASICSP